MFVGKRGVGFSNIFACQRDRLITESTRQRSSSGLFHGNNLLLMPEFSGGCRQQVANNLRTGVHIVVPVVLYCQQDVGWSGHELC